jgi:hypothetical protein
MGQGGFWCKKDTIISFPYFTIINIWIDISVDEISSNYRYNKIK